MAAARAVDEGRPAGAERHVGAAGGVEVGDFFQEVALRLGVQPCAVIPGAVGL